MPRNHDPQKTPPHARRLPKGAVTGRAVVPLSDRTQAAIKHLEAFAASHPELEEAANEAGVLRWAAETLAQQLGATLPPKPKGAASSDE